MQPNVYYNSQPLVLRDLPNRSLTRRKRPRLDGDADIKLGFAVRVGIDW